MATSAFKSTTQRTPIGVSTSRDSGRRSRSHSRFSRPIAPDPETKGDYNKNVPRGKFVNTRRGSVTPFPDISLDDLALEFFSSSSWNENESDGVVDRKGRSGKVARWASDTASSRRRGRSVSVSRGDVSSSSTSRSKNVSSSDAVSRRRRSVSVARYQISDSESEVDHSRRLSIRANDKAVVSSKSQVPCMSNAKALSNRRIGRSRSRIELSLPHDDYSSHSSTLTDEESKDFQNGKTGYEKIIRTVYAHEKPRKDIANGGTYEAMRKGQRYNVEEIRSELNHAVGNNHLTLGYDEKPPSLQDLSKTRDKFAMNCQKMEKCKQENRGISKVKLDSRTSRGSRKRSCDRNRMWDTLIEEAERYIEDLTSNVDTDISSFDGERSDGGSSLGGIVPIPSKSMDRNSGRSIEMDGVIYPWLQWETIDCSPALTPATVKWEAQSQQDTTQVSGDGSWSPSEQNETPATEGCKSIDMSEYLHVCNEEEVLLEMYRERNRLHSGGLLLCYSALH